MEEPSGSMFLTEDNKSSTNPNVKKAYSSLYYLTSIHKSNQAQSLLLLKLTDVNSY